MLALAPEFLPIRGGTGTYLMEIAKRAPKNVNFHILTSGPRSGFTDEELSRVGSPLCGRDNIHLHTLDVPELTFLGDIAFKVKARGRVRRLIRRNQIDVILSGSTMPDFLVSTSKKSVPIVTTVHSTIEDHHNALRQLPSGSGQLGTHERLVLTLGPILRASENIYYRGDRHYISVSDWGRENLMRLKGIAPSRIRVIHNGVDGGVFNRSRASEAAKIFPTVASIAPPRVLILSRLTASKVTPYLSEAIRRVSEKSDVHFIFAGSERNPLLDDSKEFCTFLGHVPHELTPHLYSLCEIFVLPSLYENFPISLLEAMASECAVVASDVGGIPEVVSDGVNGLLVSPRNPDALVEKIGQLADNPDFSRKLGGRARECVTGNYSWDVAAATTYDYLEEVASGR